MLKQPVRLLAIVVVTITLLACGQQESAPAATSSEVSKPTATSTATLAPPTATTAPPTPAATLAPPTATTAPPTPTATPVPPTPTPTPTPAVEYTTIEGLGFKLVVDGKVDVENSGLTADNATNVEGITSFEHGGVTSNLIWFQDSDSEVTSALYDSYTSLKTAHSDLTFELISEGDELVDSQSGKYLSYATTASSGEYQAGGITGSWRCLPETLFSLTVTGTDLFVIQVRFKRLLDKFTCTS
ncbi:MAG: hypothetical protein DK304_001217 [Chloroflexi bacterium]|nr:MAG: hypothetical protein DK304_001217 [Chloroflexota bacterium]